jgi:hypothetical protein
VTWSRRNVFEYRANTFGKSSAPWSWRRCCSLFLRSYRQSNQQAPDAGSIFCGSPQTPLLRTERYLPHPRLVRQRMGMCLDSLRWSSVVRAPLLFLPSLPTYGRTGN